MEAKYDAALYDRLHMESVFPKHMPSTVQRVTVYGAFSDNPDDRYTDVEDPKLDADGLPVYDRESLGWAIWQWERIQHECRSRLKTFGASEWPHNVPDSAPEWAKDAKQLLHHSRAFSKRIGQSDIPAALIHAFMIGRMFSQYRARWAEPLAAEGLAGLTARRVSINTRSRDAAAKRTDWQRRASEIWRRNPNKPKAAVARDIANQYDPAERPSVETIRKAIVEPAKKLRR